MLRAAGSSLDAAHMVAEADRAIRNRQARRDRQKATRYLRLEDRPDRGRGKHRSDDERCPFDAIAEGVLVVRIECFGAAQERGGRGRARHVSLEAPGSDLFLPATGASKPTRQ